MSKIYLGEFDKANALFQQAKAIKPDLPDIYSGLLQTTKADLPQSDIEI